MGVEISGSAVHAAKKWVGEQLASGQPAPIAPCEFILADFFEDEWLKVLGIEMNGGFELVYDYAVCSPTGSLCRHFLLMIMRDDVVPRGHESNSAQEVGEGMFTNTWDMACPS